MRTLILVNQVAGLGPEQSTWDLAMAAGQLGVQAAVAGVQELAVSPQGNLLAHARLVHHHQDREHALAQTRLAPTQPWSVGAGDLILLRTNPARDQARAPSHAAALTWASMAKERGARVLNDPAGLLMSRDKLYLARLPAHVRPRTLVSAQAWEIEAFLDDLDGPGVLKPLSGTHGKDVFLIRQGDRSNLGQILDVLCRGGGYVMAQEYVPEAKQGDVRLLLLRGELMEAPGGPAAVRRVPPEKGFRSNVHAGGRAEPVQITEAMREVVAAVAPRLRADGLFLVGLDLIGRVIVEVNAYSPGGLGDAGLFADSDFAARVLQEALRPDLEA